MFVENKLLGGRCNGGEGGEGEEALAAKKKQSRVGVEMQRGRWAEIRACSGPVTNWMWEGEK